MISQVMDMAAIEEHQLLRNHSSGINPEIIKNLLLPYQFYSKIVKKLQNYFESRNADAQYPGLLGEDNISQSSFSVRFAESDSEMQRLRQEILAMAERRVREKKVEYERACETVKEMRDRHSRMSHDNFRIDYSTYCYASCGKCSLQREINNYRVGIYERPLKPEDYNQNGVVFELLMPLKIECLRDVLYLFVTKHYKSSLSKQEIHGNWISYHQISQYNRSHPEHVNLGSTSKLVETSHYDQPKHPDCPFNDFVVNNGYNCTFFGDNYSNLPIDRSQQSVKEYVAFSVEIPSVYSSLQWTLSSTSHTQNEVLTKQCECPETLSLNEFINFGSLRADGHRLQLRNLYRVLETGGLSFETQSVLALVMQSLWEAGPLGATGQWYREAHEDFADGIFAMTMIDLLEKFVGQQASNWKHPLKLITVACIATKAFEINCSEANADRIAKLLIQIREIVVDWISLIVETIGRCPDEKSRAVVYANLVEVAICGVFTYNVSRHHSFYDKIFTNGQNHSSLFSWLHFIVTINCNILLRSAQHGIKRQLLRMVYNIAVNVEDKIRSLVENNSDEVHKFVQFRWSESRTQTIERVQHCVHSPQIIFMAVRSEHYCNYVQIDLVCGEFLVNQLPVSRIPATITSNHLFLRIFADTIFEVQPTNRSFSTVYQYDGFNYIFRMDNDSLIITEQRPNDNDRELIPPETLIDEIPYLLIENYSHWWNKATNIFEFRPKTFGSQEFSAINGVQYELNLNTRQLKHRKTNKLLLDIRSKSYQRIVEFVSRLEQKNFIHVLMDAPAKAKVHLMRMNLKFVIDCTNETTGDSIDVESNEYCGMRISLNQTFGTLIGCQRGLLLEAIPTKNKSNSKLLIVPHGKININRADPHVSVDIDLSALTLRNPTFFRFQVDIVCQQINADNFPGWFYLAYLHAVTSHHLPDPFTGMSGTERALQILQSARVWSPSPYDAESISTLGLIAALAPIRTFYPPHLRVIQRVQWPATISSTAAQDSYLLIVQKLMSDSQRLSQLYFQNEKTEIKTNSFLSLNERDHARHLPFSPNFNISRKFIHPRNTVTRFEANENGSTVAGVRQLATNCDEMKFTIPDNVTGSILGLLTSKTTLRGVSDVQITNVIEFGSSNNLENLWIHLYDSARFGQPTRAMFQILLSYLHFEGNSIKQLYILQAIAENAQEFYQINPPDIAEYCETGRYEFERGTVEKIIKNTEIGLETFLSDKEKSWGHSDFKRRKIDFQNEYICEVSSVTSRLTNYVERLWPCDEVGDSYISSAKLNITTAIQRIDRCLRMWNNNRKLVLFIREVEAKLNQLNGASEFSPDEWPIFDVGKIPFPKYAINFEEKSSRNFELPSQNDEDDIERARKIFVERSAGNVRTLVGSFQRHFYSGK